MQRTRRRVLLVGAGSTALAATDWPLGLMAEFWRDHAMLGALVSGLVLFAVGYVIIEAWLARVDEKRWRRVADTGFQDLADVQLRLYRTLTVMAHGREGAIDVHDFEPLAEEGSLVRLQIDAHVMADGNLLDAVSRMSRNREWCALAYPILRELEREQRDAIARWAPVMIQSDRLCLVLDRVVTVSNHVRALRGDLRGTTRRRSVAGESKAHEMAPDAWRKCLEASFMLRDDLHAARGTKFENPDGFSEKCPGWEAIGHPRPARIASDGALGDRALISAP